MPGLRALAALALFGLVGAAVSGPAQDLEGRPADAFLGSWAGTLEHDGETVFFGVELEAKGDGTVVLKATLPPLHAAHQPFAQAKPERRGDDLRLGPFTFHLDRSAQTLDGVMPEALVPVYRIPFVLHRVDSIEAPARPVHDARVARPVWTARAGAPLWPGPTFAGGRVLFGGEDGVVHALDARTGKPAWTYRTGGRVRTRPTVAGAEVYVAADDGSIYKLGAAGGEERWRARVDDKPIERLPFDNPKSRYDRFGADVVVADGRLYVGTHDGRVLALDPASGRVLWQFATGGSVLGAPAAADGRLYAGSFDGFVYALDAATGALLWKTDTRGAVVSMPAVAGDRLVIGNRAYDLLGLDRRTGEPAWKRYVWFSWIESSATVRDDVAYVGSSDAAAVLAVEARSGRRLWQADVLGWAWGQPAVTATRVYVGTSSTPGYMGGAHRGGAIALDLRTGRTAWRFGAAPGPPSATYGFPGSPAVGDGLVFFTGLDGNAYAFRE